MAGHAFRSLSGRQSGPGRRDERRYGFRYRWQNSDLPGRYDRGDGGLSVVPWTRSGDAPTAAIRAIGCSCKADAPASTRRDRRMRAKAMLSRQERSRQRCVGGCFTKVRQRARKPHPQGANSTRSGLSRCCRVHGSRLSCSSLLHLADTCCLHGVCPNARCCPRQHSGTVQWLLALTQSRLPTRWRT